MNRFRVPALLALCAVVMIPAVALANDAGSNPKDGALRIDVTTVDASGNPIPGATIRSESGHDYAKPIRPRIEPLGVQPPGTEERNNRKTPRSFGSSKPNIGAAGRSTISNSAKPGNSTQNRKIMSSSDFRNRQRNSNQQQPASGRQ